MYIKESEIRRLIRKKLIQEATLNEDGKTASKDILSGVAAGVGTGAAATAGYGALAGMAGAAGVGTSSAALAGYSAAVAAGAAGAGTAGMAGSAAYAGATTALGALGPPGWIALGVVGLGVAAYFLMDHADGGVVANEVLNGSFYQKYKNTCLEISNNFAKQGNAELAGKWKSQPQTITNQEADAFAERLYEATKGGFLDMGLGTDEDEIQKVLNEIPTCVDVSFVSVKFAETYKGSWTFDPNLLAVFNEELDKGDFSKYVESPLADKMNIALINIFGTVMGQDQWSGYIDASKTIADEAEKAAAEAEDNVKTELGDDEVSGRVDNIIYTTSESDAWEYKVNQDTGCWLTRKKANSPTGAWRSLGKNRNATRILDRQFPEARTADQKENCPATGGGTGGAASISPKGADEIGKRSSVASPSRRGASDVKVEIVLRANPDITTLDELCGPGATKRFAKDVVIGTLRETLRTGGKANVFNSEETINIVVDFSRDGDKIRSIKRRQGSRLFQLMRFEDIKAAIERFFISTKPVLDKDNISNPNRNRRDIPDLEIRITMPAGVYSNLNESKEKELINLIRKMVKK
jgi:hypothetical protein